MKKTILKVLASMLVLAMAITALVIPNSTAKAATDYYLHGWINGADCNGADLKFTDGKLSTTFTQESYVYVNDGSTDNSKNI